MRRPASELDERMPAALSFGRFGGLVPVFAAQRYARIDAMRREQVGRAREFGAGEVEPVERSIGFTGMHPQGSIMAARPDVSSSRCAL